MEIDIVAAGDELLLGYRTNTNASFIAQSLVEKGFLPSLHTVVGDNPSMLFETLAASLKRGRLVIMTGGLGPTVDDLTRKVLADLFKRPLVMQEALRAWVAQVATSDAVVENQLLQPEGACFLQNSIGTASGIILEDKNLYPGALLIAMPGIPSEMKEMVERHVLPELVRRYQVRSAMHVMNLHFVGLFEEQLDPILRTLQKRYPHLGLGIYPSFATVTVQLRGPNLQELEEAEALFIEAYGKHIYQSASGTLAEALHEELLKKNYTIATAESCTGGAIGAALITNPGASAYFVGSIVAYTNQIKENLLDVDSALLEQHGAVSEKVTQAMAQNVAKKLGASIGIATSGILGPTGATPTKPVGTVCASIALNGAIAFSTTFHFHGSRLHILERTVQSLLASCFLLIKSQQ